MTATDSHHRGSPALVAGLLACLLLAGAGTWPLSIAAQTAVSWRGEYYDNVALSGPPALVRTDESVDFAWGAGSPGEGVPADGFSVRWTSYAPFSAGAYAFALTMDDGARLWVDEQPILDQWEAESPATYTVTRNMTAGYHSVRLEYYDAAGDATCRLSWSTGTAITDWRGEYFDNPSLNGSPVLVRNDAAIQYEWGNGSPASGMKADHFSVRWTRTAFFSTEGTYTFSATADDGVRVWVDDAMLIDRWMPQTRTEYTAAKYLTSGNHEIRVEYYEATGAAVCKVSWALGGTSQSDAPRPAEVIVDDTDSGFATGGDERYLYGRSAGYGGHLYWTWNSDERLYNWARWYPGLNASGNWEVSVWVPRRYFSTRNAVYTVRHNGANDAAAVDQSAFADEWVSLGTYYFAGLPDEYVSLGDDTGEAYGTRFVGFDAVRFVLRGNSGEAKAASECAIAPVLAFGRVWSTESTVRGSLGCATEREERIWAVEQPFQNGYVLWRKDDNRIYVFYANGTWDVHGAKWAAPEMEEDPAITPPSGYFEPERAIGKVWREESGVRGALGWATTEERGLHASAQRFERGTMLWSDTHGVVVLFNDNTWQYFD